MKTIGAFILFLVISIIQPTRAQAISLVANWYFQNTGNSIVLKDCPFTDIEIPEKDIIVKAYSLGITNGTSEYLFSPSDKIKPYQVFLIIGRTLMLIVER